MATIGQFSRINRTSIINYRNFTGSLLRAPFIDLIYRIDRVQYSGNLYVYFLRAGDTWYNIANKLFKNSKLWWVLADLSDVVDPFTEFFPGDSIFVPNKKVLMFDMLNFEVDIEALDAQN